VVIVVPDKVEVRPTNLFEGDSTMTAPMMTLAALAEKGPDVDVLHQRVQFMAQRLMDIDVEGRCGAGYDEKAPARGATAATAIVSGCARPAPAAPLHAA
jgi:anthranilate phosphoribosyltransferase